MPQLFCLLEDGGRTLLTRAQGGIQLPSFPTLGLLSSIATYSEGAGYQLTSFGSTNVRVVYLRKGALLLLLATSNLLVQVELLQRLLGMVYSALELLLGPHSLRLDTPAQVDALRKKLRSVSAIDSLIADETLVPCLMLGMPQVRMRAAQQQQHAHMVHSQFALSLSLSLGHCSSHTCGALLPSALQGLAHPPWPACMHACFR